MKRRLAIIAAAAAAFALAKADYEAAGRRWWAHIEYLASDQMKGRQTGSKEYQKGADYVAAQLREIGVQPAGVDGGWFQPVQFRVRRLVDEKSSLALVENGKTEPLRLGVDAMIVPAVDAHADLEAPLVFIGYGLKADEAKEDDLAGSDLRGRVAVYIASAPATITGPVRAHYQSAAQRWKALRSAGAVGVIAIPLAASMDIPWDRMALSRFGPRMSLADPSMNETAGEQFTAVWNPEHVDELLAGTGHSETELASLAVAGKPLPHFPLRKEIRAHMDIETGEAQSPNVVGKLVGADPRLRNEYVVMSAHLDHLGVGAPINGDAIYNGAMDNASGIASLIEVARALRSARLQRSVLFLAVCGEEKGLLGSRWYATHPTVPAADIVADINVDMFLPLHPLHWIEVLGLNESTLGAAVQSAAKSEDVGVQADRQPERNLFIRSDQYSFIREGVPSLAFKFGFAPGSPEEKLQREWLHTRYHAPSDDTKQPVDAQAAARFDAVVARVIELVANNPARPQWTDTSFFRRFAHAPAGGSM